MKHLAAIFGAIVVGLLGAYVLWQFKTGYMPLVGVLLVLLGIGMAVPAQLNAGSVALKGALVLIVPVVKGAIAGGDRKDDPKADGSPKDGAS